MIAPCEAARPYRYRIRLMACSNPQPTPYPSEGVSVIAWDSCHFLSLSAALFVFAYPTECLKTLVFSPFNKAVPSVTTGYFSQTFFQFSENCSQIAVACPEWRGLKVPKVPLQPLKSPRFGILAEDNCCIFERIAKCDVLFDQHF
jgi:hypothetical protein